LWVLALQQWPISQQSVGEWKKDEMQQVTSIGSYQVECLTFTGFADKWSP